MKLITILILIISFAVNGISNEQYVFPPKFQTPGTFVTDSSLYLPPESQTTIPYFPVKKLNNLPFPYLPPTGTKSPISYPPSFPIVLSSSMAPKFDNDDADDNEDERDNKIQMATQKPQFQYNSKNRTENVRDVQKIANREMKEMREMRPLPKMFNYQHPIDRVDIKLPPLPPNGFTTATPNQTARSMIISGETHRNDWLDLIKSGSSQNNHFVPPPGVFLSSTTEPAIPILRLSNEMDLDGSFSYEALGADQTHYVQHSHMENLGSDKAEQVVEGSYSYVGDNGQTYTVHYIADSNGFRASGDHLPVAPPIPEIIQRSIQYNLAEEAKKPPQQKSWQSDDQERDYNEMNDKSQRFAVSPLRNLFTGKTPEAFSYDFSQRSQQLQNALTQAASNQNPVKSVPDFSNNQSKNNAHGNPILPQVTFLASHGAHVPNVKTPPQSVERIFQNEKSVMPQLVNYENDESSKALWRWQYGLNSNNANQTPGKNTISRSSGDGDDVMINFSEMTPEQYTKMLQSQVATNPNENKGTSKHIENTNIKDNLNDYYSSPQTILNENQKYIINKDYVESKPTALSTEKNPILDPSDILYRNSYSHINNHNFDQMDISKHEYTSQKDQENKKKLNAHSKINTQNDIPPLPTQEYNFEDSTYEPKRIKTLHPPTISPYLNNDNNILNNDYDKLYSSNYAKTKINEMEPKITVTQVTPTISTISDLKFMDFNSRDDKDEFRPIMKTNYQNKYEDDSLSMSTTQDVNTLNNNIFLSKLLNSNKNEQKMYNKIIEDTEQLHLKIKNPEQKSMNNLADETKKQSLAHTKNVVQNSFNRILVDNEKPQSNVKNVETKSDKISQYANSQNTPFNDMKSPKKKVFDISDVLDYLTMKHNFESSKIRPKKNPSSYGISNPRHEMHYIPVEDNESKENDEDYNKKQNLNNIRPLFTQPGELRGNIKNYKVLQRNNNIMRTGYDSNGIKRELMPPPVKIMHSQNLPPLGRAGPSTRSYLPPLYI